MASYKKAVDEATWRQAQGGGEWCVIRSPIRANQFCACEIRQARLCGAVPLYVVRDDPGTPAAPTSGRGDDEGQCRARLARENGPEWCSECETFTGHLLFGNLCSNCRNAALREVTNA
jgi:hypothetical protein